MPEKHPKRPRDLNQWAKRMVDLATGNAEEREPDPDPTKDQAAVSLGRRGGLKGGKARAAGLWRGLSLVPPTVSEQRQRVASPIQRPSGEASAIVGLGQGRALSA